MPTISELAALVGGEVFTGSGDTVITGPASLADAQPGEISFFAHPRYANDLRSTRAVAVLVPADFAGETAAALIRVENPSRAFVQVTGAFIGADGEDGAGVAGEGGGEVDEGGAACVTDLEGVERVIATDPTVIASHAPPHAMHLVITHKHALDEADFRGEQFRTHGPHLKGNNDLLTLTQPKLIKGIHKSFLNVGANIICTNTFNATVISQADYGLEAIVPALNRRAVEIARAAIDEHQKVDPGGPFFVAGVLGPTNRTASISPDVNDPAARNIDFETLRAAYREACDALLDGGVDIILIETRVTLLLNKNLRM